MDEDVAEVMRRLEKCDEEGRCFECMRKHRGNSLPYWIRHPADEMQEIQDVEFCYDCYDRVRNARRRELGMSHFSDDDGCDSDSDDSDRSDASMWNDFAAEAVNDVDARAAAFAEEGVPLSPS